MCCQIRVRILRVWIQPIEQLWIRTAQDKIRIRNTDLYLEGEGGGMTGTVRLNHAVRRGYPTGLESLLQKKLCRSIHDIMTVPLSVLWMRINYIRIGIHKI